MKIRRRTKNEIYINVAPLVEVMLVLIIIFMLTAPTLNVGIHVDLPKTSAPELNDTKNPPVIISINKNGELFVEESKFSTDELIQKLPHILKSGNSDTVYVRGDKDLPYGRIMEVMSIISSAGLCKVSLIATPDDKKHEPALINNLKINSKKTVIQEPENSKVPKRQNLQR